MSEIGPVKETLTLTWLDALFKQGLKHPQKYQTEFNRFWKLSKNVPGSSNVCYCLSIVKTCKKPMEQMSSGSCSSILPLN